MRAKKQLDPVKTREEILAAATRCFSESGFAGASIADVAKQAGVPKSLVQYHFGSKEQLWDAVTETRMKRMVEGMHAFLSGQCSFLDLMRTRFDNFAENPDSIRLMTWIGLQMPPLPKPVRENASEIRSIFEGQGPDLFLPLLMLCAMDGWHQNHRLYARVFGPQLLDPETGTKFRDGLLKTYENLSADRKFNAMLADLLKEELV